MPVITFLAPRGRRRDRDGLGSVVATYKDGWLTADRSYDTYGETRAEWNDVGRFGWVGGLGYRETRREWVSHYVRARHYGYPMGMWTSVDPLWPSEAAFGYVGDMPVAYVDPFGLQGNAPPRRMGPPITMRDRPRPANRPPRNNHGRGRPTPVLPVPQPKPPMVHGKCRMVTCNQRNVPGPWPSHVVFCVQTANPNKSCVSHNYPNPKDHVHHAYTNRSCLEEAQIQVNSGAICFEETIDCSVASLACECVQEWQAGTRPLPNWGATGTCYGHGANLYDCACHKLALKGLSASKVECVHKVGTNRRQVRLLRVDPGSGL
jgi:RHS repeat-associated protein